MINATPTPSSVSGQVPKDQAMAPKAAPIMATPKKKLSGKVLAGLVALFLIVVGAAAGFYMIQQGGFDVRQQAAIQPGGGDNCLNTQRASNNVCGGPVSPDGPCTNDCRCGYSGSTCGNKAGGDACYSNSQCQSNTCTGGSADHAGTCSSTNTTCPGGYTNPAPAPTTCNSNQRLDVTSNGCGACVAKPSVNCYVVSNNCGISTIYADSNPTCNAALGQYSTQSVCQSNATTPTNCWKLSATSSGSYSCSLENVASLAVCDGSQQGTVNGHPVSFYTLESVCTAHANTNNGTGGTSKSCFYYDAAQNTCLISSSTTASSVDCSLITLNGAPQFNTLQDCLSNRPGLNIEAGQTCKSSRGCTCASGPDREKTLIFDGVCAAYRVNGAACTAGFQCRTTYCAFNGGVGQCADIPNSMQPCTGITTPTVCQGRSDCSWNGTSCVVKSGGTGTTAQLCPNPPNLPAKKWVKFTCPNGCSLTTENGVTDWRCYENRQDSATPLSLVEGECGQVDVLSGDTDATYCGYTQYTCNRAACQRQTSPSPVPSPSPVNVSCANLQPVDATTLAPLTSVTAGQQVRFRCSAAGGLTPNYFFFTARSSTTAPLNLIYQGDSDLTFPITVTDYLHVQCNPCVGTTCATAQNVNQSCNFEYTKTTSPGPQCLALWMASSQNPTVALTNPKVGDRILLGCGQVQGAARYVFRVTEPDGTVVNLGPLDATAAPRTSQEFAITKRGRHYAQCQICTGQADSTCFPYETLPSQGQ